MERFESRRQAGKLLAKELNYLKGSQGILILGLPRGGVPVAFEVARALEAPLDVLIVRKLGVPGHEELAMGAIASGGIEVLNHDVISEMGIDEDDIAKVVTKEKLEVERRERMYRSGKGPLEVQNKWVILVDDGLATGATMLAAIQALRQSNPKKIVVAVPVAPKSTCTQMSREADELICLHKPEPFGGVGYWYQDFTQTTDGDVRGLLQNATSSNLLVSKHNFSSNSATKSL